MIFSEEYEKFNSYDKDEFRRSVSLLISKTFLVKSVYSTQERRMRTSREYIFVERNFELIEGYLKPMGWVLSKNGDFGVITVKNIFGHNKVRLSKFTTLMFLVIRLIYEEEREKISLRTEVFSNVSDIVGKLLSIRPMEKKPSAIDIKEALAELKKFGMIEKRDGDWSEAQTEVIIYPSVLFALNSEKIAKILELSKETEENFEENNLIEEIEE